MKRGGPAAVQQVSEMTDHADRDNSIIDWEEAKVIDRESNRNAIRFKEATWMSKTTPIRNRDEGDTYWTTCLVCQLASRRNRSRNKFLMK